MRRREDGKRHFAGKRAAWALIILSLMLPIAGCWDNRYLDKLGVVIAVGVDDDPREKMRYQVTVQVVLPQNAVTGLGGGQGSPVMTLTERGDTLFEAIRKMTDKTPRRLFFSHTQLLVIGEKIARKGVYPLMDLIERNADIRSDIHVVIARNMRAEKLLQIRTQMESIPATQMKEMVGIDQTAKGQAFTITVRNIASTADSEQKQLTLPSIGIEGDKEAGNTKKNIERIEPEVLPEVSTMAVFREGKLIRYLTSAQSRGFSWMENKISNTVVKLKCPQSAGYYIVEVSSSKTKLKVEQKQEEKELPRIFARIRLDAAVHEVTCAGFDMSDESHLTDIEKALNEAVVKEATSAIEVMQKELKVDALGWGQLIYQNKPELWHRISGEWKDLFPELSYKVECISHIESTGTRTNSIAK
ncbi:Ger(x)C family spore germination protein [Paenibacillus sp. HB172176]|uniref:Ger(x)C family spore germination protein n=1 Tax=Paenibacillus sp. HB172176 TaxID=2493690 RepID=UPI00143C4D5A|nr:Ger(x)C family spore germination protein [Paenibacillus sp. HB172176]